MKQTTNLLVDQIFDNELLDEEFCEYLRKRLDDKVVDELQIEIQVLIGDIVPRAQRNTNWNEKLQ